MAAEPFNPINKTTAALPEKRFRSIFDLSSKFFDGCRFLSPTATSVSEPVDAISVSTSSAELGDNASVCENVIRDDIVLTRWTCNSCKVEFDSLMDQRSHFKSDIHRFNVKLSIAGKDIVKEEDFDNLNSDSLRGYDVSSISGSEDEAEKAPCTRNDAHKGSFETRQKIYIHLQGGEKVSIWRCLLLNESESFSYENDADVSADNSGIIPQLTEREVVARLRFLTHEPRDKSHLRIVLLASGGHFAGCVFDGNLVVVHKTFHRYVIRAKSGRKQSSKDATGKTANSAGAALRRYNELALKKEIQELLAMWKSYFDACTCIFIHAPSTNRQLLYNGDKPHFSHQQHHIIYKLPLTVRRPTLKEVKRIYNQLTQVSYEVDDKDINIKKITPLTPIPIGNESLGSVEKKIPVESVEASSSYKHAIEEERCRFSDGESESLRMSTPLHEAAKSDNAIVVLELLEHGLDPCIKNERGRTAYEVTNDKEVRNTFRRFMASNLDKWDWHSAKVPSALTKEMEESQAAKQAEKDAKKKAKAKELKKLRKAREKETKEQTAASQNTVKNQPPISKEEERKRAQTAEREQRAAAAERRMAAQVKGAIIGTASSSDPMGDGLNYCSCCNASLAGKVPFHRYSYKYCTTSCMYLHKDLLQDG